MNEKIILRSSIYTFLILIFVIIYLFTEKINIQQQQINQLCAVIPLLLDNNELRSFENCRFDELEQGTYIMCYADYRENSALLQFSHYQMHYDKGIYTPYTYTSNLYIYVHNVPRGKLDNWENQKPVIITPK